MTATVTRRSASELHGELESVVHQLDLLEARWHFLAEDGGPEAELERLPVAREIQRLRAREQTLAADIAHATEVEAALLELRNRFEQQHSEADRELRETLALFAALTRERFIAVMTACAEANHIGGILRAHDAGADLPRPFDARLALRRAVAELGSTLVTIPPVAVRPDASLWRDALRVLTGEADEGERNNGN